MDLNKAQKKAVSHKEGPCLVLAGPGSGKTLTIAKRIEYLIRKYKVRPEEILVITFTKYAAKEMRERFHRVMGTPGGGVTFGTFHGIYYGILKWAYHLGPENLLADGERETLLRECAAQMEWESLEGMEEGEFFQGLADEISLVKNNGYPIESYESAKYGVSRFRQFFGIYEETKKKLRKIDFEDMLVLCLGLFRERPDILKKWQQKFTYILVDEFQDINQVQYEVIRMLAAPEDNLFVVGDDDQSVYGFRGAKPHIMKQFASDYPNARKILLDVNYRSTAHIVNGASRVIRHNKGRYEKAVHAIKGAEETVHIQETQNAEDESMYLLEKYREYIKQGIPPEQMAVLYRTALDARALAETFTEYQIPFRMKEKVQHLYEHFICEDLCSYFRLALRKYERKDMLRAANRPNRYLSRDSMAETPVTFESLRTFYCDKDWMQDRIDQFEWDMGMIADKTAYAAIRYIRKRVGYDEFLKEYSSYRGLDHGEILEVLEEIEERSKKYKTLSDWLAHVEEYRELLKKQKNDPHMSGEGIEFLTMHGAKGLEYEVVFIIQANEGTIPYRKAQTAEETEEERRLFYVGMTRAKKKLIITYVKEKNGKSKEPSRFIDELFVRA